MNDTRLNMLNNISIDLNRIFAILILFFGTTGNILNCFILSQPILRLNPCGLLFLTSSIANLISMIAGLPTRILAGWNIDPTDTIHWICKSRVFFVFTFRTIAFWLIALATIDRWLSSSIHAHYRRLSTLKNAKYGCLIISSLAFSLYIHILYCYQANSIDTPLKCYSNNETCRLATDLIYAFITIVLPLVLMFLFGLLTIRNIRHSHRRIQILHMTGSHSINLNLQTRTRCQSKRKQKKIDHRLVVMLLFEILIAAIFTLPQAIEKFHSTLTTYWYKSEYNEAIDSFLYNLFLLLSFLESGMPFYIYTLAGGKIYRNALKNVIKKLLKCR